MLAVELGAPILVKPSRAKGVRHGGQEGHVLAPARFTAQANAINTVVLVGHRGSGFVDEAPGRCLGHLKTGLLHQVCAVHNHRAFAIKRCSVELAIDRQTAADRGQNVVGVPFVRQIVQRHQPVLGAPDRNFVGADCHHIELTTFGGDVLGDALAQHVFFQRDPFQFDVGVLRGEVIGQTLHSDHVAVVYGRNGDGGFGVDCGGCKDCGHADQAK